MASLAGQAETFKDKGNELFKAGKYVDAVRRLERAHAVTAARSSGMAEPSSSPARPSCSVTVHLPIFALKVWSPRRARAQRPRAAFGAALMDATKAIELDPSFTKAYYRRASANMALSKFKDALKDYTSVAKVSRRSVLPAITRHRPALGTRTPKRR